MSLARIIFEDIPSKHKEYTFGKGVLADFNVIIIKENGYVNASKLCKLGGKEFYHYLENKASKEFIKEIVKLRSLDEPIIVLSSINNYLKGSYIHPSLLMGLLTWISPRFMCYANDMLFNESNALTTWTLFESSLGSKPECNKTEKRKQLKLANELRGFIEVKTPVGIIDILTPNELIEVKEYKNWKHALGQVISYGDYYPHCQKVIYLFGCCIIDDVIIELCEKHDVEVRSC